MLRYLTAGESHGRCMLAILEGMPCGLKIRKERIDLELRHRQSGYGRGPRMKLEKDKVEILSGLRKGLSLGSPIALMIANKDYKIDKLPSITSPRPGHADLAGVIKYGFSDVRDVLERSSARETVARVAIGAICKIFLEEFKVQIKSKLISIVGEKEKLRIRRKVERAKILKDTLGGIFEVRVVGVPIGLGSYVHYDRRLDARLAQALISIPAIKAVEFGLGFGFAEKYGSEVHDAIYFNKTKGYFRKTNNAGGIEGGVSNGEDIIIRCCMKPISTLGRPLDSVDIITKKPTKAAIERADTCAVEAAGVIAEGAVAFELAKAFLEKFGSDAIGDIKADFKNYAKRAY